MPGNAMEQDFAIFFNALTFNSLADLCSLYRAMARSIIKTCSFCVKTAKPVREIMRA